MDTTEFATKKDLEKLEKSLTEKIENTVSNAVKSLTVSLTDVLHQITSVMATKDEIKKGFREVNARLDNHDERFDRIDKKLENIDVALRVNTAEHTEFYKRIGTLELQSRG